MPYLYAYTKQDQYGSMDVALVAFYDTQAEAETSKDVQELCYSDDGLHFMIQDQPIDPEPNTDFLSLVERISK